MQGAPKPPISKAKKWATVEVPPPPPPPEEVATSSFPAKPVPPSPPPLKPAKPPKSWAPVEVSPPPPPPPPPEPLAPKNVVLDDFEAEFRSQEWKDHHVKTLVKVNTMLKSNYTWSVDFAAIRAVVPWTKPSASQAQKYVKSQIMWPLRTVSDGIAAALGNVNTRESFMAKVTNTQFRYTQALAGQQNHFALEDGQLVFYRRPWEDYPPAFNEEIVAGRLKLLLNDEWTPIEKELFIALCVDLEECHGMFEEAVIALLDKPGVPLSTKLDTDGNTALHLMAQFGRHKIVKKLVEVGADVNVKNNNGLTPLHVLCKGVKSIDESSHLKCAQPITHSTTLQPNVVTPSGHTALHLALRAERYSLAAALVKDCQNIDVSVKDQSGKTALDYAVARNHKPTIALLERAQRSSMPANNSLAPPSAVRPQVAPSPAGDRIADLELVRMLTLLGEIVADDLKDGSAKQATLRALTYSIKRRYGV